MGEIEVLVRVRTKSRQITNTYPHFVFPDSPPRFVCSIFFRPPGGFYHKIVLISILQCNTSSKCTHRIWNRWKHVRLSVFDHFTVNFPSWTRIGWEQVPKISACGGPSSKKNRGKPSSKKRGKPLPETPPNNSHRTRTKTSISPGLKEKFPTIFQEFLGGVFIISSSRDLKSG